MTPEIEAKIRERFIYDPHTGELFYKIAPRNHEWLLHQSATRPGPKRYLRVSIDSQWLKAHRVIWFLVHNEWPEQIDHINRIRGDNRLTNLRASSQLLNAQNRTIRTDNPYGIIGVYLHPYAKKRPWQASFKGRSLGYYETKEKAILV